jgi:hypothetical protein
MAEDGGNTVVAQLPRYEQLLHERGYLDSILKEAVAELKCNTGLREVCGVADANRLGIFEPL